MAAVPSEFLGSLLTIAFAVIGALVTAVCILTLMWWRSIISRIGRLEDEVSKKHHRIRIELLSLNEFDKELLMTLELVVAEDKKKLSKAMSVLHAMAKTKKGFVLEEGQTEEFL